LLLCHGRWCYRRMSRLVLYMFYKNIVLVMPIFYFSIMSLFSGQKIYYEFLYQLYNVVLTSLPIVLYGIFDQDVGKELSLQYPQLYRLGIDHYYFNYYIMFQWIANGIWHSAVVFLIPLYAFGWTNITDLEGKATDMWWIGTFIYFVIIILVNLKVVLETYYLTWMTWLGFGLSMLAWFVGSISFSAAPTVSGHMLATTERMFSVPMFYIAMISTIIIGLSRDMCWKAVKRTFYPQLYHLLHDVMIQPKSSLSFQVAQEVLSPQRHTSRGYAFSEADNDVNRIVDKSSRYPTNNHLALPNNSGEDKTIKSARYSSL